MHHDVRRKLVTGLAIGGFVFCIAGGVTNAAHVVRTDGIKSTDPTFSVVSGSLVAIGAICFGTGAILGWRIQGTYDRTRAPSKETQSLVLRMPGAKGMGGAVTLRVRNGDTHEFQAEAEIVGTLAPGMIGTATILGDRILGFEPDKTQPHIRATTAPNGIAGKPPETP